MSITRFAFDTFGRYLVCSFPLVNNQAGISHLRVFLHWTLEDAFFKNNQESLSSKQALHQQFISVLS